MYVYIYIYIYTYIYTYMPSGWSAPLRMALSRAQCAPWQGPQHAPISQRTVAGELLTREQNNASSLLLENCSNSLWRICCWRIVQFSVAGELLLRAISGELLLRARRGALGERTVYTPGNSNSNSNSNSNGNSNSNNHNNNNNSLGNNSNNNMFLFRIWALRATTPKRHFCGTSKK